MTKLNAHEEAVREYYEANSRRFLKYGQGGGQGAIHRAVWGPGVSDRAGSFEYVNDLILARLATLPTQCPRVVDMGCGIGATLTYLAERRELSGLGVTLSPTQASLAQERLAQRSLTATVRVEQGSFLEVPAASNSVDAVFAVEAFVHTAEPKAFFAEAARLLKPGGLLMLCDDFLTDRSTPGSPPLPRREQRWLDEFRTGWRVDVRCSAQDTTQLSAQLQSRENIDLTSYLELGRPRDHLIRVMVSVGRHLPLGSPWWGNLLGGNGLQRSLLAGTVAYRFLVFERVE